MTLWNPEDTPNFSREEMECSCGCGRADMDAEFMTMLQHFRDSTGALKVTSGFRCPDHPAERRKEKPGSHSAGLAADVVPLETDRYSAVMLAFRRRFKGIGIAKTFIHVDNGHPNAHRPALWTY